MNNEILILKKDELEKLLGKYSESIIAKLNTRLQTRNNNKKDSTEDYFRIYNSRSIKKILDISNSSFEKIQSELPLHKSNTGRLFAYAHDLMAYFFDKYPPYHAINRVQEILDAIERNRFYAKNNQL